MERERLEEVLRLHKMWLNGEDGGQRADLNCADLRGSDLRGSDLRGSDLRRADLSGSDLSGSDLSGSDLNYADLSNSDLSGSDLNYANLRGSDLRGIFYNSDTAFFALQCPEEGSFIAWKKCAEGCVVKLLIPEDAKRSSATTRKCRASKAEVLEIYEEDGTVSTRKGIYSAYATDFWYMKGSTVELDSFNPDRWNECSSGIHFFITRKEAENY